MLIKLTKQNKYDNTCHLLKGKVIQVQVLNPNPNISHKFFNKFIFSFDQKFTL